MTRGVSATDAAHTLLSILRRKKLNEEEIIRLLDDENYCLRIMM